MFVVCCLWWGNYFASASHHTVMPGPTGNESRSFGPKPPMFLLYLTSMTLLNM